MADSGVLGRGASHKITEQLRVLQFEYPDECRTFRGCGRRVFLLQVAQQQHVELAHAAPAAPAQLRLLAVVVRPCLRRAQCCRSAIIFLISAMAFAGFRSLGQACAQFMIVWQR